MAPNLPFDEMQHAWQNQDIEAKRMSLEEIRRDADRFRRRTRLNKLFTYVGFAVSVAIYISLMWHPRRAAAEAPTVARISMALVLAGTFYAVYQYRKQVLAMPISAEIMADDCLSFHRRQLGRLRDYYRMGWWLSMAPIIPGFAVGFIGLAVNVPARRRAVELSAVVFLVLLYQAWTGMRNRADKLQRKLDRLDQAQKHS